MAHVNTEDHDQTVQPDQYIRCLLTTDNSQDTEQHIDVRQKADLPDKTMYEQTIFFSLSVRSCTTGKFYSNVKMKL